MNDQLLLLIYRRMLRFYPRRFYAQYAEEMELVFRLTIDTARQEAPYVLAKILLQELIAWPVAVIWQHIHERGHTSRYPMEDSKMTLPTRAQIRFVRWLTRGFGLAAVFFFLYALVRLLPGNPHLIPLTVTFLVTGMSVLLGWRFERLGGLMTILCSVLLALAGMYGTYLYEHSQGQPNVWIVLLAGLLWGFPFFVVGWLFIKVSKVSRVAQSITS